MRLQRNSLLLFLFVVFLCCASVSFSLEILSDLNQTIVSRGNIFELGLFQPDKYTRSWYIGIWYKEDPKRTVLWVANRNHPLFESNFSLRLTDNNLILYNHLNLPIWSTNLIGGDGSSSQPMVVELLDSGNLVLKNTNKKDSYSILWQSFDFPTDTLLPEMTLGMNPKTGADIFLQSWISSDNPASGVRIMEIVNRGGLFQIFVNYVEYGFNVYAHRRDPWNGIQFGDMPQVFEWDKVSLTFVMSYGRNYSRLTLTPGGNYNLYKWVQEKKEWELSWSTERDVCSGYPCGSNAYCLENKSLLTCLCIEGFIPLSTLPWAAGNKFSCRRKTKLNCRGDEFLMLKNMRIPDTTGVTVDMKINSKECLRMCQGDCYCTAFAYVGIGQRGCVIWTRELTDIRNYSVGGQDLYVRLASNETGDTKETRLEERYITLIIVGGIAAFILGCFCLWKRMKRGSSHSQEPTETEIMMTELSREVFSFIALRTVAAATDNFSVSNELGRGGFGVVYKGILDDGTIVAVKRLSRTSLQGTIEFRNEVRTVLNVLHINLVRLLSCCCEGTERILVYEYMENLSLNRFLFRGALSRSLSWEQKFRIMGEIAQGLSYLHNSRDSPILHRDLKPSNILLDSNMTAKISDFGMAKFLESGQTEAQTQRVVGSYGYMSEEYAVSRIIIVFSGYMSEEYAVSRIMSDKSDLFSFGVVILEIIMEKQNFKFCNSFPGDSIIDLAWRTWNGGNYLSLVNSHLEDDSLVGDEVLKCLQIALCCLQDEAGSRPNADSVVLMLRGRSPDIPRPIKPNYYYSLRLARLATAASSSSVLVEETVSTVISSSDESVTFNEYTATVINSR